ncbi:MAG: ChbG/HpnK family deacetylase [Vulcanimicrobiota bacterium]
MRFHADDLGASPAITRAVLDCYTAGAISSCSVLINRQPFEQLVEALQPHPGLGLRLHLNLSEGYALTEAPRLCRPDGSFRHSFQSLALDYLFSPQRAELRRQLQAELEAQCHRYGQLLAALGRSAEVGLDSHEHFHFLPFVFEAVSQLAGQFAVVSLRLPPRTVFLSHFTPASPVPLLKALVLTGLGRWLHSRWPYQAPRLLVTGTVDPFRLDIDQAGEVIFHPGQLAPDESGPPQPRLARAYRAEHRKLEHEALLRFTAGRAARNGAGL